MRSTGERLTSGKVAFSVSVLGTPRRCSDKLETYILRIGQEAIVNAVRHAHARRVDLEIAYDCEHVRLRVRDDGCGFDSSRIVETQFRKNYGLVSMKERAADVGGLCTVHSSPGRGAEVVAEFPLDPAA
jgi:signal transduction histidine kinase